MSSAGDKRVLVTGGAGFIGSNLVDRLVQEGRSVLVLDNFNDYYDADVKRSNLESALAGGQVELVEGDIRDESIVNDCLRRFAPEVVYHLGALVGVRPSVEDPLGYEAVNVRGTINVFRSAAEAGVGVVVFASSSSVYGNTRAPFREDDPAASPLNPYAASKRAGELFGHGFSYLTGLPIVAARLFTVYGPRQRPDLAIHKFTRLILTGQSVPRFGDGSSSRDYTYVGDIVEGLLRASSLRDGFQIINLGGGQKVSLNRLIAVLEKLLGVSARVEECPPRPEDMELTWADVSKARELLDWTPTAQLEDGVAEFIEWYRTHH